MVVYFFRGVRTEAKMSQRLGMCCITKLYPKIPSIFYSISKSLAVSMFALITKLSSSFQQYQK